MEFHPGRCRARSLRRRSAVIVSLFALFWAAVAASVLPEKPRRQPEGWYRRVGLVNLVQFVAIALVVVTSITVGTLWATSGRLTLRG